MEHTVHEGLCKLVFAEGISLLYDSVSKQGEGKAEEMLKDLPQELLLADQLVAVFASGEAGLQIARRL